MVASSMSSINGGCIISHFQVIVCDLEESPSKSKDLPGLNIFPYGHKNHTYVISIYKATYFLVCMVIKSSSC